jgi:aspartyl/asparaginyl beta-hydroxylase (cupin superfamily)
MVVATVLVSATAGLLPLKYMDREHLVLEASCVTLAQLATSLRVQAPAVEVSTLNRSVCFESAHPSLREVASALESQAHLTLKLGYCGSGATLLFGGYPIGRPQFAAAP